MDRLPTYWLNGERATNIAIQDRSYHYGDGCFTTAKVCYGEVCHWQAHWQRISHTCQALMLNVPEKAHLERMIAQSLAEFKDLPELGLKILLSRSPGGRGYAPDPAAPTEVMIQVFDYPKAYPQMQAEGIRMELSNIKLADNPMLAGLKHNNRLEQILVKTDLAKQNQSILSQDKHFDDAVVLDIHEHVIEASSANLFWVTDGAVYTPSLERAGVSGIAREQIIQTCLAHNILLKIGDFSFDTLKSSDEIFISNALHAIVPVIALQEKTFPIGKLTRQLQEFLPSV